MISGLKSQIGNVWRVEICSYAYLDMTFILTFCTGRFVARLYACCPWTATTVNLVMLWNFNKDLEIFVIAPKLLLGLGVLRKENIHVIALATNPYLLRVLNGQCSSMESSWIC